MTLFDVAGGRARVAWTVGGDPSLQMEFEQRWALENPYMRAGIPLLRTGICLQGEAVVPDEEVRRTAYYNEFVPRSGVLHDTVAAVFWESSLQVNLSLARAVGKPSHGPAEVALLRTLIPHLQRAVLLYRRLHQIELEHSAAEEALDRLPIGVIILGTGGTVRSYNAAAGALFAQNDGVCLGHTGLQIRHALQAAELRELIASACAPPNIVPAGGWLQVSRLSGRRPFAVFVAPLRLPDRTLGLDPPRAIVFITDPERAPEALEQTLGRLYGLTPAESTVTAQLLAGASVAELAEQLEITEYTARTHLKRIFDKVGVHSQAELVRVLLNGVAGLRQGYK
jgi:DNA-binding CsgD family transcriptional regulator/PAS domain-containing protein